MGIPAPHHRPLTVDTGLLLLPLAGATLGLAVGAAIAEAVLGAILGGSIGILAGTTLRTLRSLPYEARALALMVIVALILGGGATLALLVWR